MYARIARSSLRIVAEQQGTRKVVTPMTDLRKKLEQQRVTALRDNLNKLASIATADVKLMYDALTELDTLHKRLFEHKDTTAEEEEGNIFLKKGSKDSEGQAQ